VTRGLVVLFNDSGSADKFEGFSSEDLETRGVSPDFTIRKIGKGDHNLLKFSDRVFAACDSGNSVTLFCVLIVQLCVFI